MKTILLIAVVVCTVFAGCHSNNGSKSKKETIKQSVQRCKKETGIRSREIEALKNGVEDEKLSVKQRGFICCIAELMISDNVLDNAKVRNIYDEQGKSDVAVETAVELCKKDRLNPRRLYSCSKKIAPFMNCVFYKLGGPAETAKQPSQDELSKIPNTEEYPKESAFLKLLSQAESGKNVAEQFKQNYQVVELDRLADREIDLINGDLRIEPSKRAIQVRNVGLAKRVLKAFGKATYNLSIKTVNDKNEENEVIDLIVEHCADTLDELAFESTYFHKKLFDRLVKPFKALETLKIKSSSFSTLDSSSLTFPQIFPNVKNLNFENIYVRNNDGLNSSLDNKFKHLEHLSLAFQTNEQEIFVKLIKKNPHIQKLTLLYCENDFVKAVSESLPQLETVELKWGENSPSKSYTDVHFKSVKNLTIDSGLLDYKGDKTVFPPPNEMFFKNVENLKVFSISKYTDSWTQFIARSSNVRKLEIEEGELEDTMLNGFKSIATNLDDFQSKVTIDVQDEALLEFIKSHAQLRRVRWSRIGRDFRSADKLIQSKLGGKWAATHLELPPLHVVTFMRK